MPKKQLAASTYEIRDLQVETDYGYEHKILVYSQHAYSDHNVLRENFIGRAHYEYMSFQLYVF